MSACLSKLFPPCSKMKQSFALWFDDTERFSLKPHCESESYLVEQTSNWNGSKIDPCDFVLRVVWGSALYKELRWGFGEQGLFVGTDRPYWGWVVWNLGTAGSPCVGMEFSYPDFGCRSKPCLRNHTRSLCATERKLYILSWHLTHIPHKKAWRLYTLTQTRTLAGSHTGTHGYATNSVKYLNI